MEKCIDLTLTSVKLKPINQFLGIIIEQYFQKYVTISAKSMLSTALSVMQRTETHTHTHPSINVGLLNKPCYSPTTNCSSEAGSEEVGEPDSVCKEQFTITRPTLELWIHSLDSQNPLQTLKLK